MNLSLSMNETNNTVILNGLRIGRHEDCINCDAYGIWENDIDQQSRVCFNWNGLKRERNQMNDRVDDIMISPCWMCLLSLDWMWFTKFQKCKSPWDSEEVVLGRNVQTGNAHTPETYCCELLENLVEESDNSVSQLDPYEAMSYVPRSIHDTYWSIVAYPPWDASDNDTEVFSD